jgi:hypothetical protein
MEIVSCQLPLADRAITMCIPPQTHAFFTELMATDGKSSNLEIGLTDDAHPLLCRISGGLVPQMD